MNCKSNAANKFISNLQTILFILFVTIALTNTCYAKTGHYQGHGISFSYPETYQLSTSVDNDGDNDITLDNGPNSIEITVMKNDLIDGFDDMVIKEIGQQFAEIGYAISDAKKENKQIPLKVKGESRSVQVDAVKYSHNVTINQNDMSITLQQTLFFFSYGNHGYMIIYTRINSKYSDFVKVLSTFTFDRKALAETRETESVY